MVQFWEDSNTIDSNCQRCVNDAPYYIPILRNDFVHLRLPIPQTYIDQNSGGLPSGSSVSLTIVSEDGTVELCKYNDASGTRFQLGLLNYGTAGGAGYGGEYQFLASFRLKDEDNHSHRVYKWTVAVGDLVVLDDNGTIYSFYYGVDATPFPIIAISSTILVYGIDETNLAGFSVTVNGVAAVVTSLTGSVPTCDHEDFDCFRFKVSVNFVAWGQSVDYYTKVFKVVKCPEQNPTIFLQGVHSLGTTDCFGHRQETGGSVDFLGNMLFMRVYADIDQMPGILKKSYTSRCNQYKSEYTKRYRMLSDPMPQWCAEAFENIALSKTFRADGVEYKIDTAEQVTEINDVPGSLYQFINVPLSSCKCETVDVC